MKKSTFKSRTVLTGAVIFTRDDLAKLEKSIAEHGSAILDFSLRQYSPRRATVTGVRLNGQAL